MMTSLFRMVTKSLVLTIAGLTIFIGAHSTAKADEVFVAGFTNGCFGAACSAGASAQRAA